VKLKRLMRTATTVLGTSLLAGWAFPAHAEIPLFIFAGQSNMVGYSANAAELVGPLAPYAGSQTKVSFWGPNSADPTPEWGNMIAPTEPNNAFGPEVSAGKDIADTLGYPRVAIVKHAVGATSLAPVAGMDWAPYSYELSLQLLNRAQAAASVMPSKLGDSGKVSAFFWMQGETDAANQSHASNYLPRLQEFISLARTGYGQPNMPFIMGQVNPSWYAPYWYNVQAAQAVVAQTDPRTALVLTDDLPRASDDLHYTSAGIVELGLRFAHAYRQFAIGSTGPGLLVNSGFEAQRISTSVGIPGVLNGGGTVHGSLKGWTDGGAGVTLVRSHAFGPNTALASQGSQWLSLKNGRYNGGNGFVVQTFATQPGKMYTVWYTFAALSAGNGAPSSFWVGVNNAPMAAHTVNTTGTAIYRMTPWQSHSFTFVASGSSTTLGFASSDPADGSFFGAGIDNVQVY